MIRTILCVLLILFTLLITSCYNDNIFFKNGELIVKTDILDTSGCKIKYKRNKEILTIDNTCIDKVVFKKDTIDYKFACLDSNTVNRLKKFEEDKAVNQ